MEIVFDLETDGLLDSVTKVHCVGMWHQRYAIGDHTDYFLSHGVIDKESECFKLLDQADVLVGHNIIGYDLPVLKKLYNWEPKPGTKIVDTLVLSRLIFTNLKQEDKLKKKLTGKMVGSHSLEAWGIRLGKLKGDYGKTTDWKKFTKEMGYYCLQDVKLTKKLYEYFNSLDYSQEAIDLEMDFAEIIHRQVQYGFKFNVEKAKELYVKLLKEREKVDEQLRKAFKPWYQSEGEFTPKRPNKTRGYTKGGTCTKIELLEFNPNSRHHVVNRLKTLYGWRPKEFTDNGQPKIDEAVLRNLKLPNCDLLEERFTIQKRISQLAEGDYAWLKLESNSRIHGRVNTNGAVTGRCTHSSPNIAQVPASYSKYGTECRSLFHCDNSNILIGADADGLELRVLAHYLAKYDGGVYAKANEQGDKSRGTDAHGINKRALGIDSRDTTKTFFYAFIYGAGDTKLGKILGGNSRAGKKGRNKLLKGITGLDKLTERVQLVSRRRGYLSAIDGRRLHVRSQHSALNTLLQSAGAILMKKTLVLLDNSLQFIGLEPGVDYEFVANIHDEFQIETKERYARHIIPQAEQAFIRAGEYFQFRCKITGSCKKGSDWSCTH
jgi:DNA polymerase I-like protein with 3'-5' exonuclease and polymerase domains